MSYLPSIPFPHGASAVDLTEGDTEARAQLRAIVERAQAGDLGAQSELVRRYTKRVSVFVRSLVAQSSAVEDIVQMMFIKMVRRIARLREPEAFESWLFTLARNTAFDFFRHSRSRPATVPDDGDFMHTPAVDSGRDVSEIMEALEVALTHLSPKDRRLVTLIVQGHGYRMAAKREGLSVGAVKLRLNRVRPFLRASVGEAMGLRPAATVNFRLPPRCRTAA
jgi:RNA polymerase sigma-70 factor (ECF subfamily)